MALSMLEKPFKSLASKFEGRSGVVPLGEYYFDYNVPATDNVGPEVAEWSGTYSSMQILARSISKVRRTKCRQ